METIRIGCRHLLLDLLIISSFPRLISSLRLTETIIPHYAVLSRPVTLQCNFSLENDSLLSLKWYKDGDEFFRYVPSHKTPVLTFPVPGITVNMNNSDLTSVELERATLMTKGSYRCEITAGAPTFQTVYDEQYMGVMALPVIGPTITGSLPWYNLGDTFTVQCGVEKTFPPPRLDWYINEIPIDGTLCECMSSETIEAGKAIDGTAFYSTKSRVKFQLDAHYFHDGSLVVECKAVYPNSNITIQDTVQANIKAGLGLQQYAADLFSSASKLHLIDTTYTTAVILFLNMIQILLMS